MSQENDKNSHSRATVSDGIHPEETPFEPGYQPETLPKISVPDLPEDAQGLTAEALAQVPTLTDSLDDFSAPSLVDETEAPPEIPVIPVASAEQADQTAEPIQDAPVQADTWVEELHVRMGKLTGDIHTLNARLDRLEERNKTKA